MAKPRSPRFVLMLLAAASIVCADGVDVPEYEVVRAVGAVRVDGRLDDPAWKSAPRMPPFVTWDGGPAPDLTVCRLLWDSRYLYLGFECRDSHVVAKCTKRDQPLYATDDVVEAFLDPDGRLKHYAEIIVNPKGVLFDAYQVTNEAGDAPAVSLLDWDMKGCRVATSRTRDGWVVELAVPFSCFPWQIQPPKEGTVWRAAITRYDRPDPKEGELRHYAWSPPYRRGWPHVVARFGKLVFR
ncbi:MAG: carbohydrate-binding family 9-like protein [Armatimonadota bacterium]